MVFTITTQALDPERIRITLRAGNSGKIYLEAERVNIGKGVRFWLMLSTTRDGLPLAISLSDRGCWRNDFVDMLPGVDIDHPQAIINIGRRSNN